MDNIFLIITQSNKDSSNKYQAILDRDKAVDFVFKQVESSYANGTHPMKKEYLLNSICPYHDVATDRNLIWHYKRSGNDIWTCYAIAEITVKE